MSNPQITGRTRLGPTEALRAVFSSIGRLLMAADRSQGASGQRSEGAVAGDGQPAGRPRRAANGIPEQASRWRSLDQTGNVRLLTAEDFDDDEAGRGRPGGVSRTAATAKPAPQVTATPAVQPAPQAKPAPRVTAKPAARATVAPAANGRPAPVGGPAPLPLASYDTLSLASLRARLRTLDVAQLRALVEYEAAHAERPDVLGMLERRIEKLENGG